METTDSFFIISAIKDVSKTLGCKCIDEEETIDKHRKVLVNEHANREIIISIISMDAELRQSSVVFNNIGKYRYVNRSGVQMNEWEKNYRVLSILIYIVRVWKFFLNSL